MYGTCSSIGILIFNILISGKPLSSIMQLCIMQLCNLKTNLIKTLHSVIKCIKLPWVKKDQLLSRVDVLFIKTVTIFKSLLDALSKTWQSI